MVAFDVVMELSDYCRMEIYSSYFLVESQKKKKTKINLFFRHITASRSMNFFFGQIFLLFSNHLKKKKDLVFFNFLHLDDFVSTF